MISVGWRVWVAAWDLLLVLLVHGLVCDDRGHAVCVASAVGCAEQGWQYSGDVGGMLWARGLLDGADRGQGGPRHPGAGVMTYGRVALLVNGLIDPLRRVPLDWSIEWCIGWGVTTGPLSD